MKVFVPDERLVAAIHPSLAAGILHNARQDVARATGCFNVTSGVLTQRRDVNRQGYIITAYFDSSSWTGRHRSRPQGELLGAVFDLSAIVGGLVLIFSLLSALGGV